MPISHSVFRCSWYYYNSILVMLTLITWDSDARFLYSKVTICFSVGHWELFWVGSYVLSYDPPPFFWRLLTTSYFLVIHNTIGSSCIYPTPILVSAISPRSSSVLNIVQSFTHYIFITSSVKWTYSKTVQWSSVLHSSQACGINLLKYA